MLSKGAGAVAQEPRGVERWGRTPGAVARRTPGAVPQGCRELLAVVQGRWSLALWEGCLGLRAGGERVLGPAAAVGKGHRRPGAPPAKP